MKRGQFGDLFRLRRPPRFPLDAQEWPRRISASKSSGPNARAPFPNTVTILSLCTV
jgi:hypothetical protein